MAFVVTVAAGALRAVFLVMVAVAVVVAVVAAAPFVFVVVVIVYASVFGVPVSVRAVSGVVPRVAARPAACLAGGLGEVAGALGAVVQWARAGPVAGLLAVVAHALAVVGRGEDEDAVCAAEGPVVLVVDGALGLFGAGVGDERDGAVAPLLEVEVFDLAVLGEGLSDALLLCV